MNQLQISEKVIQCILSTTKRIQISQIIIFSANIYIYIYIYIDQKQIHFLPYSDFYILAIITVLYSLNILIWIIMP